MDDKLKSKEIIQNIYITKYALKKGIIEFKVYSSDMQRNWAYVRKELNPFLNKEGEWFKEDEWFLGYRDALQNLRNKIDKMIDFLDLMFILR